VRACTARAVHSRSAAAVTYPMIICAPIGVVGRFRSPAVHVDGVADSEPHFTTPTSRVAGEYSAARVGRRPFGCPAAHVARHWKSAAGWYA
jgi:hypothetical protein